MDVVLTDRNVAALKRKDWRRIVAGAALCLSLAIAVSFDREGRRLQIVHSQHSIFPALHSIFVLVEEAGAEDAPSMHLDY